MPLKTGLFYENEQCYALFEVTTPHGFCTSYKVALLSPINNGHVRKFGSRDEINRTIDRLKNKEDLFIDSGVSYLLEGNGPRVEMLIVDGDIEFRYFDDNCVDLYGLAVPLNKNRMALVTLFTIIAGLAQ